jgi:predicted cobalt transporter CbtA
MQIDAEIAARLASTGVAAEAPPAGDVSHRHLWWVTTAASVLVTAAAVLLVSCLAVIVGLT